MFAKADSKVVGFAFNKFAEYCRVLPLQKQGYQGRNQGKYVKDTVFQILKFDPYVNTARLCRRLLMVLLVEARHERYRRNTNIADDRLPGRGRRKLDLGTGGAGLPFKLLEFTG